MRLGRFPFLATFALAFYTNASAQAAQASLARSADSIATHAASLSKYTYGFTRKRVEGENDDEMLKNYGLRFGRAEEKTLVIEHFSRGP